MIIEETLETLLKPLATGSCWPLVAPDKPATPYIVYQNISNTPEVTLSDGVPINNTRMQIDVYAKSYKDVKAVAAAVVTAMATAAFTNVPLQNQDLYEQDVKLYRVQMDYSLWF